MIPNKNILVSEKTRARNTRRGRKLKTVPNLLTGGYYSNSDEYPDDYHLKTVRGKRAWRETQRRLYQESKLTAEEREQLQKDRRDKDAQRKRDSRTKSRTEHLQSLVKSSMEPKPSTSNEVPKYESNEVQDFLHSFGKSMFVICVKR